MRFDEVDRNAVAPCRVGDAEIEQGIDVSRFRVGEPAADQKLRTLLTDGTHENPPLFRVERNSAGESKKMVNAAQPFLDREIVDQARGADNGRGDQAHFCMGAVERLECLGVDQREIVDPRKTRID